MKARAAGKTRALSRQSIIDAKQSPLAIEICCAIRQAGHNSIRHGVTCGPFTRNAIIDDVRMSDSVASPALSWAPKQSGKFRESEDRERDQRATRPSLLTFRPWRIFSRLWYYYDKLCYNYQLSLQFFHHNYHIIYSIRINYLIRYHNFIMCDYVDNLIITICRVIVILIFLQEFWQLDRVYS